MSTQNVEELFRVTYGSKLYGTNTPTSDTDEKAVYLPSLASLLLGKKATIFKKRWDADGKELGPNVQMPANGVEVEYVPLQQFVRDFVCGQTYAVELAFAVWGQADEGSEEWGFVDELITKFTTSDVYSMVGFAMKQTFDYVKRGERLQVAQAVHEGVKRVATVVGANARLDTVMPYMEGTVVGQNTVLDHVAKETGLPLGKTLNNGKEMRTLEMNGRTYLESTRLQHLLDLLEKQMQSYGERTVEAAKADVDYKSLSHAVRVYQQALELLHEGTVTFPRPNAAFLLRVKQGKEDLEVVRKLLADLDAEVQVAMKTSTVQKRTPELEAAAEQWLLWELMELYDVYVDGVNLGV